MLLTSIFWGFFYPFYIFHYSRLYEYVPIWLNIRILFISDLDMFRYVQPIGSQFVYVPYIQRLTELFVWPGSIKKEKKNNYFQGMKHKHFFAKLCHFIYHAGHDTSCSVYCFLSFVRLSFVVVVLCPLVSACHLVS